MAFKETSVVDERMRFVVEVLKEEAPFGEVCELFSISRPTGYKWMERYKARGPEGLLDRSRAPHAHPNAVEAGVVERVLAMKRRYVRLGPKKIVALLARETPMQQWPSASTVGEILKRHGLVVARRARRRASPSQTPLAACRQANAVWSADFKGWFCTGDGIRCTPFTLSDAHTRFFLRCQAMRGHTGFTRVKPLFEISFREFGLPERIRTDNGPPFASIALAGLSELSVWWMRLGIVHERIEPGCPEQNGRHERLHRTLSEDTAQPPAKTVRAQQRAFDEFVRFYNETRPHEALDQQTPASVYTPSPRRYPTRLHCAEYPTGWHVRKVKNSGRFKWQGHEIHLANPLTGNYVGFKPIADALWMIYFMTTPLGLFDERTLRIRPLPKAEDTGEFSALGGST